MPSQALGPPIFQVANHSMVVHEPQVIMTELNNLPTQTFPNYKKGAAKILGFVQLTCGVFCMLLNVGMAFINYNETWHIAAGWWASPFMVFAGVFGFASSKVVHRLIIHSALWISLLSSALTIAVIVQGTMSLLLGRDCNITNDCYISHGAEISHYVMSSLFMIFGMLEFAAGIALFVIGCQAVCVPPPPQNYTLENGFTNYGYSNSSFPPPPPPYDSETYQDSIYSSPTQESAITGASDPYLPSYEESVHKS